MTYDVFISYRRLSNGVNGVHIARILQQELKLMGLNVFFDMEVLTDGKFNEKLYAAIEESKNVIYLMTEGSLDRCVNEGDWVRNELEHVIEKGINLIPVAPTGTKIAFPEGFPEKLDPMRVLEVSELNQEKLFKQSVAAIAARLKDVVLASDKEKKEAEEAFLVQARAFKGNDGVIDAEEMKTLKATAKELGISSARQIILIAQVEQEFVSASAAGLDMMPPMPQVVPSFDVYVSYRRDGGASNDARLICEQLAKGGYSVSFDTDTDKSGSFNEELLRRVAECKNFVLLLSKGCFDRTMLKGARREDDWMRQELATALYNKKNIITVRLPGFDRFPESLPPDINAVRRFDDGLRYDSYFGEVFFAKLKKKLQGRTDAGGGMESESDGKDDILSVDADVKEHDTSFDDIFGDDAGYWREEAELAYKSVSRVLPYAELKKLDDAWNKAEEDFKGGDHKQATRRYMDVVEIASKVKNCSSPFVTRLVGDGIDTHAPDWFEKALAKAQTGDRDYQYGVGSLYATGLGVEKDSSAAFRWFERAAAQGHVQALSAVGSAYATGEGVEVDYRAAKKYLLIAERKNDARAAERLGYLYQHGFGVRCNYAIAVSKYKEAATKGNSAAMIALGTMLETGNGVVADLGKAIDWYRSAVANGSAVAQRKMAGFLFAGKGVEKDEAEAVKLARLAANQGDADAIAILGRAYENGTGVAADPAKAEELYRKASDGGSALGKQYLFELGAEAQYRNGVKFLEGKDVEQDFKAALLWFEKAAAQGNVPAMEQLGFMHERGLGCEVDIKSAKEWYEKAVEKGDAAAMVALGQMYFRGYDGIEKDYAKAGEYFKKAALIWRAVEPENQWKVLYAFYYLGCIYTEGLGVEKDLMLGQRCFLLGAHNGNAICLRSLALAYKKGSLGLVKSPGRAKEWYAKCVQLMKEGRFSFADDMAMWTFSLLYQFGNGVEKDPEESLKWLRRAADLGNLRCLRGLARAYRFGHGLSKDIGKALELYEAAASRGDAFAQNGLSWIYYTGEGVARNLDKALAWGIKAAETGSGGAMETLYRMYRDGDGVEKDESKALEWLMKASGKGNPAALAALGDCYEHGCLGLETDMDKAVSYYRQSADKEDTRGMFCLGLCFKMGKGVQQSDKDALKWLTKAAYEADDDLHYDDKALAVLADLYYGCGDFKQRVEYFEGLDSESSQRALFRLGDWYMKGREVDKDVKRGIECLRACADLGHPGGQYSLGWAYYTGVDIPRDPKLAYEWTMKAVENGVPSGMETLFRMYRDGDGVAQNDAEALRWLELAAENPEEPGVATSELGECYERGLLGVKMNVSRAFGLYYHASQKSNSQGMFNRGRCYLHGIGTEVDVPRGVEWLSKAAETEDADDYKYDLLAMALLVKLYSEGKLVEKDDAKAAEWQSRLDETKKMRQSEIPRFVSPV